MDRAARNLAYDLAQTMLVYKESSDTLSRCHAMLADTGSLEGTMAEDVRRIIRDVSQANLKLSVSKNIYLAQAHRERERLRRAKLAESVPYSRRPA